jgi:hypothetical protein
VFFARPLLVALFLGMAVLTAAPVEGGAQPISVVVAGNGSPRLTLGSVLESEGIRQSLESGLPVRVRIETELWKDQRLDALEGKETLRATVRLDPLTRRYQIETIREPGGLGSVAEAATLSEVGQALQRRMMSGLRPQREGRFYYLVKLEVETLSLSDLEELRRWLNGDLGSAVDGRQDVGSALGRGLRRLLVRTLGLPVVRTQVRSEIFQFPR